MSVRAELGRAREVTRQDAGFLRTWYWPVFLAAAAVAFVVPEVIALVDPGRGGTLSEWTRRALGVQPAAPRRRWAAAGFAGGLLLFVAWFVPHILWDWPV